MWNIAVKIFVIWVSGLGENGINKYFMPRALAAPLIGRVELFVQFW